MDSQPAVSRWQMMGAPLDLFQLTLTRDELVLLVAAAQLGAAAVGVGVDVTVHGVQPEVAGAAAVSRFTAAIAGIPDLDAVASHLVAKLDPLVTAAKGAP